MLRNTLALTSFRYVSYLRLAGTNNNHLCNFYLLSTVFPIGDHFLAYVHSLFYTGFQQHVFKYLNQLILHCGTNANHVDSTNANVGG